MKQKVKRFRYLKGNFAGKYRGERIEFLLSSQSLSYQIEFYDCEITNCKEIVSEKKLRIKEDKIIERGELKNVLIEHNDENGEKVFYQEDLENIKIYKYEFADVIKDGQETYGTIRGKIFCALPFEEEVDLAETAVAVAPVAPIEIINSESKPVIKQSTKQVVYQTNSGCLPTIGWLYYWFLLIAFSVWLGVSGVLILGLIGLIIWLISFLFTRFPILGRIFGWLILALYVGLILFSFGYAFFHPYKSYTTVWKGSNSNRTYTETNNGSGNNGSNTVTDNSQIISDTGDILIKHAIAWSDYKQNIFADTTKVWLSDYKKSKVNRENLNVLLDSKSQWNKLYSSLYNFDKSHLDSLYNMLASIKNKNNLSGRQFLDVVVSCVQNIQYSKILDYPCEEDRVQNNSMSFFIKDNTDCLGNISYGIQAPSEFLYNLKGDCDTRTLLLYTILSHFKYDVIILCSTAYQHSLLGVNVPAYGTYKTFNSKKYYIWETTTPGWMLGQIPPDVSNLYFWDIFMYNSN